MAETTQATVAAEPKKAAPEFDKTKLQSRKEIKIRINLEGWHKFTYELPLKGYRSLARRMDGAATKWTTGALALVTMPLALMVRNGARAANNMSDWDASKFWNGLAAVSGVVAGAAGVWFGVPAVYGAVSTGITALTASSLAGIAVGGVAAAASTLLALPAFTAGVVLSSTVIGTAASALSAAPALVNIGVAWNRSLDRLKGIKYDEKTLRELEEDFEKDSLTDRHERREFAYISNNLRYLSEEHKEIILKSLQKEFAAKTKKAPGNDNDDASEPVFRSVGGPSPNP